MCSTVKGVLQVCLWKITQKPFSRRNRNVPFLLEIEIDLFFRKDGSRQLSLETGAILSIMFAVSQWILALYHSLWSMTLWLISCHLFSFQIYLLHLCFFEMFLHIYLRNVSSGKSFFRIAWRNTAWHTAWHHTGLPKSLTEAKFAPKVEAHSGLDHWLCIAQNWFIQYPKDVQGNSIACICYKYIMCEH